MTTTPARDNVVFVGGWFWRKGADLLPAVLRRVRSRHQTASLRLLGPGPEHIDKFAPEDRHHVSACGWIDRSRLFEEIKAADVVIAPYRFEGMPLSILEALSVGVPVVATDLPGHLACIVNSGTIVPKDSPIAMADAVLNILQDRVLRDRMGKAGREWALRHSWSRVARSTLQVYESAVRIRRELR